MLYFSPNYCLQVDPSETGEKVLCFYKVRPSVISKENIHSDVYSLSMLDSPCSALYQAIEKVTFINTSYLVQTIHRLKTCIQENNFRTCKWNKGRELGRTLS